MTHLKRLNKPKTWPIKKKGIKYALKPKPGPHSLVTSMPLGILLRDVMGYADDLTEAKYILNNKTVLVDGKRNTDYRFPAGLFDTIRIADTDQSFRIIINSKGKLEVIKEKSADMKLCKVTGKTSIKGKTQLNLNDGKSKIIDKDTYKVGDSLLLKLPELEIKEHIKFEKGALVYLIGGKHIGETGKIESIAEEKIIYKGEDKQLVETLKIYAFAVGKEKSLINLK